MAKGNYLTGKKERTSYGAWFVGQNIIYFMFLSYFGFFLTDEIGIAAGAVGTLLIVARVWDAVNDPILGSIVDKTQPKVGKFKPWINAVSILMPIATIAAFWNFNGGDGFNLVYAYITYIVWGMLYTISDVPIFALATTMTDNPEERVSIMSIGRLAAGLASLAIGIAAPSLIVNSGYQTTIIILMGISFVVMLPLRFFVKERIQYDRTQSYSLKEMVKAITKNKYLLIFYASFIAIGSTMTSITLAPFFAKWNLGDLELQTTIMATLALPMILIPVLLPMLIKKFGKRKLFLYGMSSYAILSALQYFVGYENFGLFLIVNALKSLGMLTPMMMMGMFTADCVEYGQYKTGERKEGITFSVQTFSTKLGGAVSGGLALFFIGAYGFISGDDVLVQSQSALDGIWIANTIIPAIGGLVAFIIFFLWYKLDEAKVADG